jgi:OOP family OmpA-OmpF porin
MRQRRTFTSSIAVLVGLTVAGCADWSYSPAPRGISTSAEANLAAVRAGLAKQASNFLDYLAVEYATLADNLDRLGDAVDVDYFARKGIGAENGVAVQPEQNANWGIPLEYGYGFRTELAQARTRLLAALDGGARDRAPALAARAQSRYDCWVERMEDDWQKAEAGPCRTEFLAAMAQLEGKPVAAAPPTPPATPPTPPTPPNMVDVYFDFNQASLSPEGKQIVQQLAAQIKAAGAPMVTVTGKTDLAGPDGYNLSLSRRRAEAVKAELVKDGVAAGRIVVHYTGKREPPVPTADGVREPRNRVVEVVLH